MASSPGTCEAPRLGGIYPLSSRRSGPDGALVATASDGALLPYRVDLHDPLTGDVARLETGTSVELNAMPSIIEIGFEALTAAETCTVVAGGTLLVMVSPQI